MQLGLTKYQMYEIYPCFDDLGKHLLLVGFQPRLLHHLLLHLLLAPLRGHAGHLPQAVVHWQGPREEYQGKNSSILCYNRTEASSGSQTSFQRINKEIIKIWTRGLALMELKHFSE